MQCFHKGTLCGHGHASIMCCMTNHVPVIWPVLWLVNWLVSWCIIWPSCDLRCLMISLLTIIWLLVPRSLYNNIQYIRSVLFLSFQSVRSVPLASKFHLYWIQTFVQNQSNASLHTYTIWITKTTTLTQFKTSWGVNSTYALQVRFSQSQVTDLTSAPKE